MGQFFSEEGPFFSFLSKMGQTVIVSVMWIVFSIPVVTVCASSSALYYSIIKSVRRNRGYAYKEFFKAFKRNALRSIPVSLIYMVISGIIGFNVLVLKTGGIIYLTAYAMILAVLLMSFVYLIPVMSRFDMKIKDMIKLSVYMSIRHFPTTVLLLAGLLILGFIQVMFLPIPTVILIPGVWCYISTYPVEKVMKKYMNKMADEDTDTWYLE